MKFSIFLTIWGAVPGFASPLPQSQAPLVTGEFRIPTVHESAVLARRILRLTSIGTLTTNLPSDSRNSHDYPIGLPDYIADCDPDQSKYPGAPTVLAMKIATSFHNVAAGSNISVSLRWEPPAEVATKYTVASLPRFSLMAKLQDIPASETDDLSQCFIKYHPDAKWWLPGNSIHESRWARLVVNGIYWVGGFGDRAYIGWISDEEWNSITEDEINNIRLPGEN